MAAAPVRNPLTAFVLAVVTSAALSGVLGFASTFIPFLEFRLFFLGVALCGVGALAARRTFLGSLGFLGSYLGAFMGVYVSESIFWIHPGFDILYLAFALALAAGLGGFVAGKFGIMKLERSLARTPGMRRCSSCGARVGTSAHKCWSCKATLTY